MADEKPKIELIDASPESIAAKLATIDAYTAKYRELRLSDQQAYAANLTLLAAAASQSIKVMDSEWQSKMVKTVNRGRIQAESTLTDVVGKGKDALTALKERFTKDRGSSGRG